jgi:hypothetical protein
MTHYKDSQIKNTGTNITKGFCKHPKQQEKHGMRQTFHSQSFTHSRAQEQLNVPHSTSSAGEEGE